MHPPSFHACALTFALLFTLGGGCASPRITLGEAAIAAEDEHFVRVEVALDLANGAGEPIPLLEWDYRVIAGETTYVGRWTALHSVPAGDSVTIRIPAVLPAEGLEPGETVRVEGNVSYRSPNRVARLLEEFGFHRPRQSFSGTAPLAVR